MSPSTSQTRSKSPSSSIVASTSSASTAKQPPRSPMTTVTASALPEQGPLPPVIKPDVDLVSKARAVAKREAADEGADPDTSAGSAKRKRTRPVSACEACRSHKVRCILKADQPVCERCAASGKQCLFRIDDLRPDFRAERFAHLGPPGKDARSIKSKPKERRARGSGTPVSGGKGSSSKDRGTAQRRTSSSTSAVESSDESEEDSEAKGKKNIKATARQDQRIGDMAPPAHLDRSAMRNGNGLTTAPSLGRSAIAGPASPPSPPSYSDRTGGSGFVQPSYAAAPSSQRAAYGSVNPSHGISTLGTSHTSPGYISGENSYGHPALPTPPVSSMSRAFRSGGEHYMSQQQQQSSLPGTSPTQQQQHFYPSQTMGPGPHFYHSPPAMSSMGSGRTPPALHSTGGAGESALACTPSYSNYRRQSGSMTNGGWPRPPTSMDSNALPPIRTAVPSLRHEGTLAGSPNIGSSTAAIAGIPPLEDISQRQLVNAGKHAAPFHRRESDVSRQMEGAGAGSPSSQSSAKKHSLVVPFFRWFGSTANTPGYRRIKVAVNPDLPAEEDDSALPDGEDDEKLKLAREASEGQASPSLLSNHLSPEHRAAKGSSPLGSAPAVHKGRTSNSPAGIDGSPRSDVRRRPSNGGPLTFSALDTDSASSASRDLFDPSRPRYPRQDVLLHLSELFIQLFRTNLCPWVQSEVLLEGARNATLPAILANSVCAMTARFSDWAELRRKSPKNAGEPFSEMAKTLIVPMLSWPSLDVIEALILLSYAEFGAGSDSGLWMYSGMGMRMATDLGLQHESTIRSLPKAEQEKARWLFWSGCYAIDRITCFGTGRPVTLLEHTIDCRPPRVEPGSQCFYASQIIQLLQRRGRMGELLNRKDDSGQINLPEKKAKLMEMWQECAGYFQSLPSTCAFSVQSFKRAASNNEGPAFLFLHVLFQSTISLLERPGIMRGRNWSDVHPVSGSSMNLSAPSVAHISASASRSIADMIALAAQVDPKSLQTSPYLDQLILPTGRAFHGEREAIKEAMRQYGYGAEQSRAVSPSRSGASDDRLMTLLSMRKAVTDNLHNCINWLGTLAHYWGGASWPARALEQEAAGASDIVPDERDDDAMQAPLRDMELLSAWARDKMKQAKSKMASRRGSVDHTRGGSSGSASGTSGAASAAAAAAAAAAGAGGEPPGMGSPSAATSIENLLAAANAARDAGGDDGRDVMDSDRALGLALSGQLATSAEINVSALIDLWTEEQRRGSFFSSNGDVSSTFGRNEGTGNATSGRDSRGGLSPWADTHVGNHNHPGTPGHGHGHRSSRGQNLTTSSAHTPTNDHSSASFLPSWMASSPHASNQQQQQQQHSSHLGGGGPFSSSTHAGGGGGGGGGGHHHNHYGNPTSHSHSHSHTAPTMGFSALQLEELLSADLLSSGNDVFPLELPDEALFRFGDSSDLVGPGSGGAGQGGHGGGMGAHSSDGASGMGGGGGGATGSSTGVNMGDGSGQGSGGGTLGDGAGGGWGLSQQHLSSALFGFH